MLICILTKNVITSCSVTMMLFLHLEVKPLMTLTTVLYLSCALISGHLAMMLMELDRKSGSAGMPRPISYAVFCLKKKKKKKMNQNVFACQVMVCSARDESRSFSTRNIHSST